MNIIIKKYNSPLFKSPPVTTAIKQTHKDQPRNTFGIIDPITKQKYPDILTSHLELRSLNFYEWFLDKSIQESADRKKPYKLLLDHRTAKELIQHQNIDCMISFQVRKDGAFAVARLFNPSKVIKKEDC